MTAEHLLAELADPACYPDAPRDVRLVQTHLSVVCLAGDRVWKLKKAVQLPFVDFTTLAARRTTCREEVRLNRRLCPTTYLGTAALRRTADGLRFAAVGDDDGPGDLDVAVVMQRLPQERMLDELLRCGAVSTADIEALARIVAAFHAGADRSAAVRAAGDPRRLAMFAAQNFTELAAVPGHGVDAALLAALQRASAADFAALLPTLAARAERGLVVDGHGDLHARNVCLTEPPTIYDCIEFEPAFRCGDVATENAFLVMDLRYRGAAALAIAYERAYVAASSDTEQPAVLPPLVAYRAMVRAKVAAMAAAEPELPAADRAAAHTSVLRHARLAAAVTSEARGPWWLVVCGPPASGKSSLVQSLADAACGGWPIVATDVVRKHLAGLQPTERARPEHYTPEFSRRAYAEVLARAAAATAGGAPVALLDGNFPTPAHRANAARAAAAAGARIVVVHVTIDAATARERAARRAADPTAVSDAGPDQAAMLHARFVPPTADEGRVLRLVGDSPTAANIDATLVGLLSMSTR
jgi:aminoglycoside phosphotransferase family enzyme/predicted kinase